MLTVRASVLALVALVALASRTHTPSERSESQGAAASASLFFASREGSARNSHQLHSCASVAVVGGVLPSLIEGAAAAAVDQRESTGGVLRRLRTTLEGGVGSAEGGALRLREALLAFRKGRRGRRSQGEDSAPTSPALNGRGLVSAGTGLFSPQPQGSPTSNPSATSSTAAGLESRLGGAAFPTVDSAAPSSTSDGEDRSAPSGLAAAFGGSLAAALSPGAAFTAPPTQSTARRLPLSSPFVRHYYKEMVVLWEWHTKTVGASMNGRRRQDEDALVVHSPCKGRANARLKALFDGHGGYEISRACAAKLFDFFGSMPDFSEESFVRAALSLDEELRTKSNKNDKSGSTGVVVAIERPKEDEPRFLLHVANVGDSRALLLRPNGTYSILTKDHKPNDPSELHRILKAGGFVTRARKTFRVDGTLALSRAFGDRDLKANASLPATEQKVVAVPDVRTFEASEGDYILIACDGMFEAMGMSWDFVANLLKLELQGTNDNLVETAFRLLNTAYLFGSSDNVSVVLTKLMPQKKTHAAIKRFCYDFSGKKLLLEELRGKSPNAERGGTFDLEEGPYVTLF